MRWTRRTLDSLGLRHWPVARKIVVAVIGGTIVLIGAAMIVLPGPGSVVIPIGLLVLASEFAWARWLLTRGKRAITRAKEKFRDRTEPVRRS
jgi:Putative transmembrane protein (PGPGW)